MTKLDSKDIEKIFSILDKKIENPKSDLEYKDDFTLLMAVMLSAQATDVGVNKVTKKLFQVADTPQKVLALGEESIREIISSINYYNTKAKHLVEMSRLLLEKFQGKVPQSREELITLPGVGRKTANVVLNIAFNQPTIAVDTHILRVSNRLGLSTGKTPEAVETDLLAVTPKKYLAKAHHLLLLFGRYTCKARAPLCETCPLENHCDFMYNITTLDKK